MEAKPGAINVIPGEVMFTVDVRAPQDALRNDAVAQIRAEIAEHLREERDLQTAIEILQEFGVTACAAMADGADGPRGGEPGLQGAAPAFGRGPRRHGAGRDRRHLHAVRALQGRHQPQSGGIDHARTMPPPARAY